MTVKTYYHILNISPCTSDEDVRRAWRSLALRWHPDRNPHNRQRAQQMFVVINHAYTVLKTKPQRDAYNRILLSSLRHQALPAQAVAGSSSFSSRGGIFEILKEIFWPFSLNTAAHYG